MVEKHGVKPLVLTPLIGIPVIQPGDDLPDIINQSLNHSGISVHDGDIFVIAQKIVSKAEGRFVNLNGISPSERASELSQITGKDARFIELVLSESREVVRASKGVLVVEHKLGFVCANAGIDHSNVQGLSGNPDEWYLLLPEDPDRSAGIICESLKEQTGKRLGVLIIDSHGRAWRLGTAGVAIGVCGLPALVDLRGYPDMFGFRLQITQIGAADELAAAASLVMGQADEVTPVVHVRGFPYPLRDAKISELIRPKNQDLFR